MNVKKIAVLTGTRADYGIYKPLLKCIKSDPEMELNLIVTGMHLEEKFGNTFQEIEKDGFEINYSLPIDLIDDSENGILKSMSKELSLITDVFEEMRPDILFVLGDRFESLIAAEAATVFRIPIAHIHGGEVTEGAIDEAFRHSITKMSCLHFAATEEYRNRIIQMGEQPQNVYNVGALGVESIRNLPLLKREELCDKFGSLFQDEFVIVTFHPVTLEDRTAGEQFSNLLKVLNELVNINIIFTYANADPSGNIINQMIEDYVKSKKKNTMAIKSMGQLGYLSALKYCKMVIGNSSSGLIEAPSFGIPTVNIGDRQKGRVKATSIIDCDNNIQSIRDAILKANSSIFQNICKETINPYEKKDSSKMIMDITKKKLRDGIEIKKIFFDIKLK